MPCPAELPMHRRARDLTVEQASDEAAVMAQHPRAPEDATQADPAERAVVVAAHLDVLEELIGDAQNQAQNAPDGWDRIADSFSRNSSSVRSIT